MHEDQPVQLPPETPLPRVGDIVYDADTDRRGVMTDVQQRSVWVLRWEAGPGRWTSKRPDRLTVVKARTGKT